MEDLIMKTLQKNNENLFPVIPSFFDDFFSRDFFNWTNFNQRETMPAVNIQETNENYELEVAAPGMNKDDFDIEIKNNVLVINAHRTNQIEEKGDNYKRKEFNYQQFQRSFRLPEGTIEDDQISAEYNNGILHICLPKKEKRVVNSSKRIEIS